MNVEINNQFLQKNIEDLMEHKITADMKVLTSSRMSFSLNVISFSGASSNKSKNGRRFPNSFHTLISMVFHI